jgi:hypothetical protein
MLSTKAVKLRSTSGVGVLSIPLASAVEDFVSSLIVKYYMPRALFKDWFLGININRAIINYVTQMKVMNPGLRERGLLPERIKYEESV